MSSNYWQIKKQSEQFKHGNTVISRINSYIKVWEERCYSNGIPEEVPDGISKSNRAPSYKKIALAILDNDMTMKSLGLFGKETKYYKLLKTLKENEEKKQLNLF